MAGTLFGLGLSQQFDINGDPLSGCKLYIYIANTTTPVNVYKVISLTPGQEHQWPMTADSTGRIPAFWLADGSYRARLTDEDGVDIWDEANITAIGPSTGVVPPAVPSDVIATTGDVKWRLGAQTLTGWVKINGTTIGSATSGATTTFGTQALFEFIWNNFDNGLCPVGNPGGARGGTSLIDWNANRTIQMLDLRGRSPFGLDDMGAALAGRLTATSFVGGIGNPITPGSSAGIAEHTLLTAEMPAHDHPTAEGIGHAHPSSIDVITVTGGLVGGGTTFLTSAPGAPLFLTTVNLAFTTVDVTNAGGGTAHRNMPPFMVGTFYWKL